MPAAATLLSLWGLDEAIACDQVYRAPTARERERWPAAQVAQALGRDPHTSGAWLAAFRTQLQADLAALLTKDHGHLTCASV
jgi:hypothetical protein